MAPALAAARPVWRQLGVSRKQVPSYHASTGRVEPERPRWRRARPVSPPLGRHSEDTGLGRVTGHLASPSSTAVVVAAACIPACCSALQWLVGRSGWSRERTWTQW